MGEVGEVAENIADNPMGAAGDFRHMSRRPSAKIGIDLVGGPSHDWQPNALPWRRGWQKVQKIRMLTEDIAGKVSDTR